MTFLKKREKLSRLAEAPSGPKYPSTVPVPLLAEIAIEVWRLADRCRKLQTAAKKEEPLVGFSIDKILATLMELGIEIKDPTGELYYEGMSLDVLTFDYDREEPPASRIIQETVSPAIYYQEKLVRMAQVIVGSAGGQKTDA